MMHPAQEVGRSNFKIGRGNGKHRSEGATGQF